MSSAVLYLAIVAVWAIVLVPMWLRRDTEQSGISKILHKDAEEEAPEEEEPEEETEVTPRRNARGRAAVIARRRRRTAGLSLLLLTAITVPAAGVAPWWIVAPPVLLLAGHLTLLRVAVKMDAAHAAEERARLAAERIRAREAACAAEAATPQAEIIELSAPAQEEVFDQYADDRRAVGE
ncbi:divisome protein SepX/GlpR [Actinomadura kijaniata]|uniref:divisome protein SepX/GlpR n=1 Tax=Actinomadura kijaniata TaxID=46161 RepID=UPI000833F0D1|nr:hypothetical protein [Actinomadura kijaniata]